MKTRDGMDIKITAYSVTLMIGGYIIIIYSLTTGKSIPF